MDLTNIIIAVLALIGTLSGVTNVLFYRQSKHGATAGATEKWISIFKQQNDILGDALNLKTKQVIDYECKLEENRKEISMLKYNLLQIERRQKGTEREIEALKKRSEHAEYYYCSVTGCKMRQPTLGTYKSTNKDIE